MQKFIIFLLLCVAVLLGINVYQNQNIARNQELQMEQNYNVIKNQNLQLRQDYFAAHPAHNPDMIGFLSELREKKAEDYESLSFKEKTHLGYLIQRLKMAYEMRHVWSEEDRTLLEKDVKMVLKSPLIKKHWETSSKNWHSREFRQYVEKLMNE